MGTVSAASIIARDPSISTSGPAMFFSSAPNISIIITTQYHPCHAAISAVVQGARGRGRRGGPGELGRSLVPSENAICRPHVARLALTSLARGSAAGLAVSRFEDARVRRVSRGIETNLACPRPPWRGSCSDARDGYRDIYYLGRVCPRLQKAHNTGKVTTSCDPSRVETIIGHPQLLCRRPRKTPVPVFLRLHENRLCHPPRGARFHSESARLTAGPRVR